MNFEDILGKTIAWHTGLEGYSEDVVFGFTDGNKMKMFHVQDCCEYVRVEEVIGDTDDLLDSPLLLAEEVSSSGEDAEGTHKWTFYKLATIKGHVTIRWVGESNGYYSEDVECVWMQ